MKDLFVTHNLGFKDILRYPDLRIDGQRVTFISGTSGCGKSTLFRLFNGTVSPSTGEILYKGVNVATQNKIELRRNVLLVKQEPYLIRGSVYENFMFFHQNHESCCPDQAEVQKYLDLCCMEVGPEAVCDSMSGGERQRIFLSIGLSLMPEVLLLDEPTSALNKELSQQVMKNIIDYAKQRTVSLLVISHDIGLQSLYGEEIIELRRQG